jgi:hypothetical protein
MIELRQDLALADEAPFRFRGEHAAACQLHGDLAAEFAILPACIDDYSPLANKAGSIAHNNSSGLSDRPKSEMTTNRQNGSDDA